MTIRRRSEAANHTRRMLHAGAEAPQPVPPAPRHAAPPAPVRPVQTATPARLPGLMNAATVAGALRALARATQTPPFAAVRSVHRQGQQLPPRARIQVATHHVSHGVRADLPQHDGDKVYLGGGHSGGPLWHVLEAGAFARLDVGPSAKPWVHRQSIAQGVAALLGDGCVRFVPLTGKDAQIGVPNASMSLPALDDQGWVAQVVSPAPNTALVVVGQMVTDDSPVPHGPVIRTEYTVFWGEASAAAQPTGVCAARLLQISDKFVVALNASAQTPPQHPQLLHVGPSGVQSVTSLIAPDGFVMMNVVLTPDGQLAAHERRDGEERLTLYRIHPSTGQLRREASSPTQQGFGGDWRLVADAEGCVLADTGSQLVAFRQEGAKLRRIAACPFCSAVEPVMSAARMVVGQTGSGALCAVRFDGETLTPVAITTPFSTFIDTMLPLPDGRLLGTADGGKQLIVIEVV